MLAEVWRLFREVFRIDLDGADHGVEHGLHRFELVDGRSSEVEHGYRDGDECAAGGKLFGAAHLHRVEVAFPLRKV